MSPPTPRRGTAGKEGGVYCPNPECPDFQEDGVPGEYIDTMTACPKCGATLVAEWPPAKAPSSRAAANDAPAAEEDDLRGSPAEAVAGPAGPLVAVAAFDAPEEAGRLVGLLAEAGITAYAFLDDGRDFEDPGDLGVCTRVLVPESQARAASRLVAETEPAT